MPGIKNVHLRLGVCKRVDASRPVEWYCDAAKAACNSGRGNFARSIVVYDKVLHDKEVFQQRLISDMDAAFAQKQFKVFFQPKYKVQGNQPVLYSAEALVRWIHPELGFISPGVFIPLFEDHGLITRLDTYVWNETAAQVRAWRERFGFTLPVSVNLSRQDLFDDNLLPRLRGIVERNDIACADLHLEVTESAYARDTERMLRAVGELRDAGFRIEMDDFGSGYSSLNMLCLMPIDALKIDMKFVQNVLHADSGYHVLELVIEMARVLGVPAIVEGVEDEAQYRLMKQVGCDIIQGYYFSRPVDAASFEPLITLKAADE